MVHIYDWVKYIALLQVALIFIMVVVLHGVRFYFSKRQHHENKQESYIETLLHELSRNTHIPSKKQTKQLQSHMGFVLSFLQSAKHASKNHHLYQQLHPLLSTHVLLPYARKHAKAWRWVKRYWSAWCFSFGFHQEDEPLLKALIKDASNLVSLLASNIAFQYENPVLIHEVIRVFSHGRRLQQSVYAELTVKKTLNVTHIVLENLTKEKDPYCKIFSYKLLKWLPLINTIPQCAVNDLQVDNVDLTVAILKYIHQLGSPQQEGILYHHANSKHWEIRAICAKLLKEFTTKKSYTLLENMLKDKQWWVRTNAAHALLSMGDEGIACLKYQAASADRFAYDAAQEALSQLE